ncbi:MAG: pilus assembly protein [Pusillimonas sp.]|nr:pilus assembly protein [Pusillimonas sp.]MBC43318.1 pilus assembly protein [Pusillimonas sp.]HCP76593.1 pilus assembly protein [Pusillimonas sp.]|tara:strand:- start:216762 stop:217607 length:846 start_codon:yes stop_codon:yes gene_type:complete
MGTLTIIFAGIAIAGLALLVQTGLKLAYSRYRARFTDQAHVQLSEVFLFLDPVQLWLLTLFSSVAAGLVAYSLAQSFALALIVAGLALFWPPGLMRWLRQRRQAQFERQLPDLLLSLAGALRAGAGLQSALQTIVTQSPVPIAQELGLVLKEQRVGVSLEHALSGLRQRMPGEGTQLLVSALIIALHTGGNLAETLERIGHTLRARLHLLGRIDALTAQGRMQAWVMAGLPVFLGLVLTALEPDAMQVLWHTPLGWGVLTLVGVLEISGIFLIRKIVRIQV